MLVRKKHSRKLIDSAKVESCNKTLVNFNKAFKVNFNNFSKYLLTFPPQYP